MTVPGHRQPGVPAGATFNVSVPGAGRDAVRRHGLGSRGGGRISRQAMPTSSDSGRSDSPVGFWWRAASGRQAQAVNRPARVSVATVGRRLGPVGRPIIIEVPGLRHDGGPGGGEPAVQGLPVARGAVRCWTATGFRSVIGLPGPQFLAIPAHFFHVKCWSGLSLSVGRGIAEEPPCVPKTSTIGYPKPVNLHPLNANKRLII